MALTPAEIALLEELRRGDENMSMLEVGRRVSDESLLAFDNFRDFLKHQGNRDPDRYDLSLSIARKTLLQTLKYADDRNCLGIQYCFGLDQELEQGGRIQLITVGAMPDHPCVSDEEVFDTNFQVRDSAGIWTTESFLNLDSTIKISTIDVGKYTEHFQDIYRNSIPPIENFRKGALLPVKALIKIFTDSKTIFGTTKDITVQWGIANDNPANHIGNFRIVIGIGDLTHGPVIQRPSLGIDDPPGDCPPRTPC